MFERPIELMSKMLLHCVTPKIAHSIDIINVVFGNQLGSQSIHFGFQNTNCFFVLFLPN